MRLLCTGDLHLGRRSSRVSDDLSAARTVDAWRRIVQFAVTHEVDALLLSGDVVDQDNRFFESLGPLAEGLRTLAIASIPVVAVAGNHDFDVLPSLARSLPSGTLTLLGKSGDWERHTLTCANGRRVHIDGWSFTSRYMRDNPIARYAPAVADGVPVIGLLHADLDAPRSQYAPVTRESLRGQAVSAWILGHVHAGAVRSADGEPLILYPGSPQPLDPGEPGVHGAWLVEFDAKQRVHTRLVPMATVQYEAVEVDLTACKTAADARELIQSHLDESARALFAGAELMQHAAFRIRLTGRTAVHGALDGIVAELRAAETVGDLSSLGYGASGAPRSASITHVVDHTRATYDLAGLTERRDAVGRLAQLLRDLESGNDGAIAPELWRALQAIPRAAEQGRTAAGIALASQVDDASLRESLEQQTRALLDRLLQQQGATP